MNWLSFFVSPCITIAVLAILTAPGMAASEQPLAKHERIAAHLQPGGTVYGYVDIEGDIENLAANAAAYLDAMRSTVPEAAMIPPVPLAALVDALGLPAVHGAGMSSSRNGELFHNRMFFLMPDGPKGLLRIAGTENDDFHFRDFAAAGASLILEQEVNGEALVELAHSVAHHVQGIIGPQATAMVEGFLQNPTGPTTTVSDLVEALSGRVTFVAGIDRANTMFLPGGIEVSRLNFVIRFENGAPMIDDMVHHLRDLPGGVAENIEEDGRTFYEFPIAGSPFPEPVITVDPEGGALFVASSASFLRKVLEGPAEPVGRDDAFLGATQDLSLRGISFFYVTPEAGEFIQEIVRGFAGDSEETMESFFLTLAMSRFQFMKPMAFSAAIEEDGLLVASNWNRSHKGTLVRIGSVNPVSIGLLASMAIPAFQRVRETAEEQTVMNNLRMIYSAAQQYFLETGETRVELSELIGPDRYIRSLERAAGETYPEVITKETDELTATFPGGRKVTYDVRPIR